MGGSFSPLAINAMGGTPHALVHSIRRNEKPYWLTQKED
jgi:hypothetical protein